MNITPIKIERVEIKPREEFCTWIMEAMRRNKEKMTDGDILIITSKIMSYFEDRVVDLSSVHPSIESKAIAQRMNAKEELIQLAMDEADEIVAETPWVLLTKKNGIYCANAGVDTSNVPKGYAVLWPKNSFVSAQKIRDELMKLSQLKKLAVIISDSNCQPGRSGTTAVAIGYSGIKGCKDLRGDEDLFGNQLRYSSLNIVDSLATAANLVMGESTECSPLAIIREYDWIQEEGSKNGEMLISPSEDMYPLV
ncbi:MAG: coenzyme F420-0:L-glutamate ligase [bacterium]|nr:coenzyme F420-0:L-glutamate ligase [bacterium]